jgi:hypothetical protein
MEKIIMNSDKETEIIETDDDTEEEDLYNGSLYPYPPAPEIDEIEVDVKEQPFSVFELARQYERNKLIINPEFQRNLVWKPKQKSQFIESILLNIPLPYLYLNQNSKGKYIVVDGLQRTVTICDFLKDKFPLQELEALSWLNGKRFSELDENLQTRIEDQKIPCYTIRPSVPLKMIYDIFKRINTGGTQLNRQEIRNCIYLGKATRLLKELSSQDYFIKAIDSGIRSERMKDQEAVLRYIAFSWCYEDYNNDMDEFLGNVMKAINTEENDSERVKADFQRVMEWTYDFFGEKNFRIPTETSRGRINISVMESVGYFFSESDDESLEKYKNKIIANFERLINDPDYLDAVKTSTGDRKRVKTRFELAMSILGDV